MTIGTWLREDGERLSLSDRRVLLAVVVLLLLVTVGANVSIAQDPSSLPPNWASYGIGALYAVATALFLWWPKVGAIATLLSQLVVGVWGVLPAGNYELTLIVGLAIVTLTTWIGLGFAVIVATSNFLILIRIRDVYDVIIDQRYLLLLMLPLVIAVFVAILLKSVRRSRRGLHASLAESESRRDEGIATERKRILDELHDIVAHDVTLIAMHARALEYVDPEEQKVFQDAIRANAEQALADMRRLIDAERADASDTSIGMLVSEVVRDLSALGIELSVEWRVPGSLSEASAQVIRHLLMEGSTNIAKYAERGAAAQLVAITRDGRLLFSLENTVAKDPPRDRLGGGYGLVGLGDRVRGMGGELRVLRDDDRWELRLDLPL